MKTNLDALNDFLFQSLETLSNSDLRDDELAQEIARSKAIGDVAKNVIQNGALQLQGERMKRESIDADFVIPKLLESDSIEG